MQRREIEPGYGGSTRTTPASTCPRRRFAAPQSSWSQPRSRPVVLPPRSRLLPLLFPLRVAPAPPLGAAAGAGTPGAPLQQN